MHTLCKGKFLLRQSLRGIRCALNEQQLTACLGCSEKKNTAVRTAKTFHTGRMLRTPAPTEFKQPILRPVNSEIQLARCFETLQGHYSGQRRRALGDKWHKHRIARPASVISLRPASRAHSARPPYIVCSLPAAGRDQQKRESAFLSSQATNFSFYERKKFTACILMLYWVDWGIK